MNVLKLKAFIENKRGDRPTFVSQFQTGRLPLDKLSMAQFLKICEWLEVNPCTFFEHDKFIAERKRYLVDYFSQDRPYDSAVHYQQEHRCPSCHEVAWDFVVENEWFWCGACGYREDVFGRPIGGG